MKKIILAATLIFALSITAMAEKSHDYVRSDGSATRVTYGTDWAGRNTVTSTQVSREQRNVEAVAAVICIVFRAIYSCFVGK